MSRLSQTVMAGNRLRSCGDVHDAERAVVPRA